jgi:hypothetical protein
MSKPKRLRLWETHDTAQCEKCGAQLRIIATGSASGFQVQTLKCANGHQFVRFRLQDIGG